MVLDSRHGPKHNNSGLTRNAHVRHLEDTEAHRHSDCDRSGKHKDREQDTPNANPALTPTNETEGAKTSAELVAAVQNRVALATVKATGTDKPVIAVEYLITASPGFFEKSDKGTVNAYFDNAKSWLGINTAQTTWFP